MIGSKDPLESIQYQLRPDGRRNAGNLSTFTYDLRDDGRREAAIETDATGTTLFAYEYDELGRLIQEAYSRDDTNNAFDLTYVDKYTFDDAGNRLTLERDTNSTGLGTDGEGYLTVDPNAFSSDRDTSSTYDDNDRILSKTVDDLSGTINDRHTVYDWDTDSTTLLGETTYEGTQPGPDIDETKTNTYNARGRLASSVVDDQTTVTTTQFDYDNQGLRVRQTRDDGTNTEIREFVFDPQNPTGYAQALEEVLVDQLGARSVDKAFTIGLDVITQALANAVTGLAAQEPGTFIYDAHGSVRQIADELGAAVQIALREVGGAGTTKIDYEAYGEAINAAISTAITTLLYSGEFTDAVSNQQYLRARYYDIGSGRFTRVDPWIGSASSPQALNKYLYGQADSITYADPSGEFPVLITIGIVVGIAIFLQGIRSQNPYAQTLGFEIALLSASLLISSTPLGIIAFVVGNLIGWASVLGESWARLLLGNQVIGQLASEHAGISGSHASRGTRSQLPPSGAIIFTEASDTSAELLYHKQRSLPPLRVGDRILAFETFLSGPRGLREVTIRWTLSEYRGPGVNQKPLAHDSMTIPYGFERLRSQPEWYDVR